MFIDIRCDGLDLTSSTLCQIESCFEFLTHFHQPFSRPTIQIESNRQHHDIKATITMAGRVCSAFSQHRDLAQALLEIRSQMVRQLGHHHLMQQTAERMGLHAH